MPIKSNDLIDVIFVKIGRLSSREQWKEVNENTYYGFDRELVWIKMVTRGLSGMTKTGTRECINLSVCIRETPWTRFLR